MSVSQVTANIESKMELGATLELHFDEVIDNEVPDNLFLKLQVKMIRCAAI